MVIKGGEEERLPLILGPCSLLLVQIGSERKFRERIIQKMLEFMAFLS